MNKDLNEVIKLSKDDCTYPFHFVEKKLSTFDNNINLLKDHDDNAIAQAMYCYYLILKGQKIESNYQFVLFDKQNQDEKLRSILLAELHLQNKDFFTALHLYAKIIKHHQQPFFLWKRILRCCVDAGWYEEGIIWYQKSASRKWPIDYQMTLYEYGAALFHLNYQFQEAIEIRTKQIKLFMAYKKFKLGNSDNKFDNQKAFKSFIDIINVLQKKQLKPFPTAGTLLGYCRENQILKHDKDIDIGIPPEDDFNLAKKIILEHPRYQLNNSIPKFTTYFSVTDRFTGCSIDLLDFWKNGKSYENGWVLPGQYIQQSRILIFSPFNLIQTQWNNNQIWRPDNTDLFLNEFYGNWQIPDKNFDSLLSPCNLKKSTKLLCSIAYNRIVTNLLKGKSKDKILTTTNALIQQGENNSLLNDLKTYLLNSRTAMNYTIKPAIP